MAKDKDKSEKRMVAFFSQVKDLYEFNQSKKKSIYWFNFLKGLASGAGAFLGGVVMLVLLLWILSKLGQVPFVGHLSQQIKQSIEHSSAK